MSDKDFNPWWKNVNNYQSFDERQEFLRGAMGYRPNNRQEEQFSLLIAGYANQKFDKPKAWGTNVNKP